MIDVVRARKIVRLALVAAAYGTPNESQTDTQDSAGPNAVPLASLELDSLAIMEFCISIELQSGLEVTPEVLASLTTVEDVVDWICVRG